MEGAGNVPFGEPHRAIRRIRLPDLLQELGEACPKLHGVGGSRFVGGNVDGRGNIIRRRRRIIDQARLSVHLVHGRKSRDTDAVAKNQQCYVHQKDNAEATLRPLQHFLSSESSSLWCQGGHMWASGNGGINHV